MSGKQENELTEEQEDALLDAFGKMFLALPPDEQERVAEELGLLDLIIEAWNRVEGFPAAAQLAAMGNELEAGT
jgi:hypothetical protein